MLTGQIRALGVGAVALTLIVVLGPATALAVPPPPPNPSDSDIGASDADAKTKAGRVGELTGRVADAEARLEALQADVEVAMEQANKALVDLQLAEDAASAARADAAAARRAADGAGRAVDDARTDLDEFAAGSFKQGSAIGSLSAYIGAKSPEDLLARAQLLNAVSGRALDALDVLERAKVTQANADSSARAALDRANTKQAAAEQAKRVADAATAAAAKARRDQAAIAAALAADRDAAERQLAEAQARAGGLQGQRERYLQWQAAKQREDEERARQAAAGAVARPVRGPAAGRAKAVIDRALSQLGMPYAWGGGDAGGPTRGIRDGGVADMFGDYDKIGFDCSGLMVYAFAGVGVSLPHYSGYQASSGRQVPLSQVVPGDLLFWADGGAIHHVALYIGNGQMVEAPFSGARVRVAAVRYGGIVPFATRVL